jgi:cytochrome c oxidase subunit 1
MSTTAPPVTLHRPSYLADGYSLKSWLLTRDHKRIAILYMLSITLFFVLGGLFALMVRLELLTPEGDLLAPDTYNRMFTMHGRWWTPTRGPDAKRPSSHSRR